MSSTSSGKSRRAASLSSINNFEHLASVEKAGWLNKWTNYLKGYRQRWFVLDSNATLSYYRNPSEVGHTCRGSINLQEARVHTDKTTSCIVISGQSQTFHVKPQNEMDRQQWTNSLEYMRHKAITRAESEEDEDAQMAKTDSNRSDALILANRQMSGKLCDLRTAANMMNKQGDELMRALNGTVETDKNSLAERADLLKIVVLNKVPTVIT